MYGIGSINFSGNTVPAGVVTAARNGLSKDAGNFIVLGNDSGDPLESAGLLNDREIRLNSNSIDFLGEDLAGSPQRVRILDGLIALQSEPAPPMVEPPGLVLGTLTSGNNASLFLQETTLEIEAGGNFTIFDCTPSGVVTFPTSIATQDPGGGPSQGDWKLGIVIITAVVFDNTQYLEVSVNGTPLKIALCQ